MASDKEASEHTQAPGAHIVADMPNELSCPTIVNAEEYSRKRSEPLVAEEIFRLHYSESETGSYSYMEAGPLVYPRLNLTDRERASFITGLRKIVDRKYSAIESNAGSWEKDWLKHAAQG